MVEALGYQLLASPALADHEHRAVERRGAAGTLDCIEEGKALADELFSAFHVPTVGVESHVLARCFAPFPISKMAEFRILAISVKLARSLYMEGQV
jgi:hypothetical protein